MSPTARSKLKKSRSEDTLQWHAKSMNALSRQLSSPLLPHRPKATTANPYLKRNPPMPPMLRKSSNCLNPATSMLGRKRSLPRDIGETKPGTTGKEVDLKSLKRLKRDYASRDISKTQTEPSSITRKLSGSLSAHNPTLMSLTTSNLKIHNHSVFVGEAKELEAWAVEQGMKGFEIPDPTEVATVIVEEEKEPKGEDGDPATVRGKGSDDTLLRVAAEDETMEDDVWYPARQLARLKNLHRWRKFTLTDPSHSNVKDPSLLDQDDSNSPPAPQRSFVANTFYPPTTEHRVPEAVKTLVATTAGDGGIGPNSSPLDEGRGEGGFGGGGIEEEEETNMNVDEDEDGQGQLMLGKEELPTLATGQEVGVLTRAGKRKRQQEEEKAKKKVRRSQRINRSGPSGNTRRK
ncbi:hypothetical protein BT69DRAFT_1331692 [Atractiella rhizophila]|nr:hypothetical protein BT69DRAFT_1331692 [Atractiella rhizophila]